MQLKITPINTYLIKSSLRVYLQMIPLEKITVAVLGIAALQS